MKKRNDIIFSCMILSFHFALTRSSSCLNIPRKKFDQVAGILSIPMIDDANFPTLLKPTCISHGPAIYVKIHDAYINLLNITISDASCNHLYETLLCNKTKSVIHSKCKNAHLIVFAILQNLPPCQTNGDCSYEYKLDKKLECEWMYELQEDVCMDTDNFLLNCEKNVSRSIRIEDFCYLTDPICSFIVTNVVPISITTGIVWGLTAICFIYFCQSICDRFTETEKEVECLYTHLYNQQLQIIHDHAHL